MDTSDSHPELNTDFQTPIQSMESVPVLNTNINSNDIITSLSTTDYEFFISYQVISH